MSKRLIVTAGSGGVGKTTVAATIGLKAALAGRRVAIVTIDPARRLAQALGLDALTGEMSSIDISQFGGTSGALHAMMLDVKTTSDLMVKRFAKSGDEAKRILENRYYIQFSSAIAGSQEYMAIEQVRLLMEDNTYDLVVLDTPPSVHALDFLDAPARLIRGLSKLPVGADRQNKTGLAARLASQGKAIVLKGLNRLTGGPFIEETAEFLRVFSSILSALEAAAKRVESLMKEDTTAFYVVATPRIDPLHDALRFRDALSERQLPFRGFIVNRVHESCGQNIPSAAEIEEELTNLLPGLQSPGMHADVAEILFQSVKSHERQATFDRQRMACLTESGDTPTLTIPRLDGDVHSLEGLIRLANAMVQHHGEQT